MKLDSFKEITSAARLAINNTTKDPDMAKKLGQYGFPPQRIEEGQHILTLMQSTQHDQKVRYDERWQLSDRIKQELQTLRPVFVDHVAAVRFAFRHQLAVLRTFDVKRIDGTKWGWVAQANAFYQSLEAHTEQVASLGTTPEELQQAKASIEALMELRDDYAYRKSVAEDATQNRNRLRQQLREWVREFHTAARLALKDNPQRLEAFGIRVRSLQK